jgi:hypothetical protein
LLTGAIVAAVAVLVDLGTVLLVLFFVLAICCCFGAAILAAAVVVGFVICCGGVADDDNKGGFTVFEIPHIFDSVVLTALRLGLPGLHIFALSSGDIVVVLSELLLPAAGGDDDGSCCANTCVLLQIAKTSIPTRRENTVETKVVWFILNYLHIIFIYIASSFLYCYHADINTRKRIVRNYYVFLSYNIWGQ